jgi:hypothetical protein
MAESASGSLPSIFVAKHIGEQSILSSGGKFISRKPLLGWFAWATLLLVAFVVVQWAGWGRTLITTEI